MNTIVVSSSRPGLIHRLQFNLWDSRTNNLHFLDIGVLCENEEQTISIAIPGVEKLEVTDLIDRIDPVVANAIFNCSVSITSNSDKTKSFTTKESAKTTNEEAKEESVLSPIDTVSSICGNKIVISIPKNNTTAIKKRYYRFRILNYEMSSCMVKKVLKSRLFESSFSSSSIIDFRINDIKLLKPGDASDLVSSKIEFGKIHFLYITDVDVDVASANCQARFLERGVWDKYLDLNCRKGEMIAYHVKSKEKVSGDCFLLKTKFYKTSVIHLIIYAAIVVGLSLLGSLLANPVGRLLWLISK